MCSIVNKPTTIYLLGSSNDQTLHKGPQLATPLATHCTSVTEMQCQEQAPHIRWATAHSSLSNLG